MVDSCKSPINSIPFVSRTAEHNFFFQSYTVSCSAANLPAKLFGMSYSTFSSHPHSFVDAMLISDIRMKSRGISLPNNQSAASRLAQHTDQHPGITTLIIIATLCSLVDIIHANSERKNTN